VIEGGGLDGKTLQEAISDHPEVLGSAHSVFGSTLPFLFKVLSIKTALSIQSHPDKALAEKLHSSRPDLYKDDNHKPEMAIALSPFEALCGFCEATELKKNLELVPEIRDCCGEETVSKYLSCSLGEEKESLKSLFTALMTSEQEKTATLIDRMVNRIKQKSMHTGLSPREKLVLRLNEQYPGDVGIFSSWFLNYMQMQTGEAIVLASNEPHAYLSGQIIECMATSDNVIRAGLTPKYKDTNVLCDSLTYKQAFPQVQRGLAFMNGKVRVYRPDFREFEVWNIQLKQESLVLGSCKGPSILLVHSGESKMSLGENKTLKLKRGDIFFIPSFFDIKFETSESISIWVAAANGMGFELEAKEKMDGGFA
jgi:mannose-6-phosphate isomerase